jgi:hypothetical protein
MEALAGENLFLRKQLALYIQGRAESALRGFSRFTPRSPRRSEP